MQWRLPFFKTKARWRFLSDLLLSRFSLVFVIFSFFFFNEPQIILSFAVVWLFSPRTLCSSPPLPEVRQTLTRLPSACVSSVSGSGSRERTARSRGAGAGGARAFNRRDDAAATKPLLSIRHALSAFYRKRPREAGSPRLAAPPLLTLPPPPPSKLQTSPPSTSSNPPTANLATRLAKSSGLST